MVRKMRKVGDIITEYAEWERVVPCRECGFAPTDIKYVAQESSFINHKNITHCIFHVTEYYCVECAHGLGILLEDFSPEILAGRLPQIARIDEEFCQSEGE